MNKQICIPTQPCHRWRNPAMIRKNGQFPRTQFFQQNLLWFNNASSVICWYRFAHFQQRILFAGFQSKCRRLFCINIPWRGLFFHCVSESLNPSQMVEFCSFDDKSSIFSEIYIIGQAIKSIFTLFQHITVDRRWLINYPYLTFIPLEIRSTNPRHFYFRVMCQKYVSFPSLCFWSSFIPASHQFNDLYIQIIDLGTSQSNSHVDVIIQPRWAINLQCRGTIGRSFRPAPGRI
mmetsp:Transcript_18064/g.36358  ORF Transcript_18064/g.36358 Transcript_18064/m.36358 type:complete len:233 (-) Transcript_18064:642-1340(-)